MTVLLLTHAADYYCVDLVADAVRRRGGAPLRVNTDRYPVDAALTASFGSGPCPWRLKLDGVSVALDEVTAVWARRLWPGRMPESMEARFATYSRREARTAFFDTFSLLEHARWVNSIPAMLRAESKLLQLEVAASLGLAVPDTVVTNDPDEARAFWHRQQGKVVTKLLGALTQTMEATGDFVYTTRVLESDLEALDDLRYCPQVFQREVEKAAELRCVVVGHEVFVGGLDAPAGGDEVDWRRRSARDGAAWRAMELPVAFRAKLVELTQALGLVYGAADVIVTPSGEHVFLELNPAGEWGMLQRDLELPIANAIATALVDAPQKEAR